MKPASILALITLLCGFAAAQSYTFQQIVIPNAQGTTVWGVNSGGAIVGYFSTKTGRQEGFRSKNGRYVIVDYPESSNTVATGINDKGQIVGGFITSKGLSGG